MLPWPLSLPPLPAGHLAPASAQDPGQAQRVQPRKGAGMHNCEVWRRQHRLSPPILLSCRCTTSTPRPAPPLCQTQVRQGGAAIGVDVAHLQESSTGGDKPNMALALSTCCHGHKLLQGIEERRRFSSCGMPQVLLLHRTKLAQMLGGSAETEQSRHLERLAVGFHSSHLRQSRLQLGLQLSIACL